MELKFKKRNKDVPTPKYSRDGDCALDLTAVSVSHTTKYVEYDTGIAVQIPEGYVGMVVPRSSVTNKDLMLKNSLGIIDTNFVGFISFRFKLADKHIGMFPDVYKVGERIGQLMIVPIPKLTMIEVDELAVTNRGDGAYGSSGK